MTKSKTPETPVDEATARMQKRERLMEMGVNPYPNEFRRSIVNAALAEQYKDLPAGGGDGRCRHRGGARLFRS